MTDSASARVRSDTLPLSVGPDRRHLVDQSGHAVLIQGDAAWSLIVNTTMDEAVWYLDQRRAQGFNVILINLIERLFASDAPRNLMGDEPFTTPGDFTIPNESYMAHGLVPEASSSSCIRRFSDIHDLTIRVTAAKPRGGTTRSWRTVRTDAAHTANTWGGGSAATRT